MKITRKQLKKLIIKEMFDPASLALGAGIATGLTALYIHIFGEEPQSEEQAVAAIKQHVDQLESQSDYLPHQPGGVPSAHGPGKSYISSAD